ncbi:nucleotide-diphospho-sugar transferase [Gautieria morchelliformis]|nr:nucleotide-diphospho-sugar transferase [Gautieria morchelliformis]
MEKDYNFTPSQDWFTHNIPTWEPLIESLLSSLAPGRAPRALEVGSWEGRSAVYLLSKLCSSPASLLVCIDHFDLLRTVAGRERHARVLHNLRLTGSPFRLIDEFSVPGLMTLLQEEVTSPPSSAGFDFVYIDGSHEADDTFLDAELAWRLARPGALFILDDYEWDKEPFPSIHHPARGIDTFLELHAGQFNLLHKGYQVILRKIVDMRIGFLMKDSPLNGVDDLAQGLGYGLNIALCVNTAYLMPATVTIRSAVEKTPGRITFYVVDCGLQEQDRRKIAESIPSSRSETTTLVFRSLPEGSRGEKEPTWAKVDILLAPCALPVERVLFLDADLLVRSDLTELWQTDLGGNSLGAARDIGHPLGHGGLPEEERGRPYFNAGVLLLDLARVREHLPALKRMTQERKDTRYKDQDMLNAFFAAGERNWHELDIKWNASGLGTYAACSSSDRDAVWANGELDRLHSNPAIVHFTGPVHPSMSSVLNEFVQPWTSKPWGYAGAPGNPFSDEWWHVLERAGWKGIRQDGRFLETCTAAHNKARERGIQEFNNRVEKTRP